MIEATGEQKMIGEGIQGKGHMKRLNHEVSHSILSLENNNNIFKPPFLAFF